MSTSQRLKANGILVLYNYPVRRNAATIMENVNAFERYSRYKVWKVNTAFDFPKVLERVEFSVIVFHYSIVGRGRCWLNQRFSEYLDSCRDSYRVAFFQDEYHYCRHRFTFIDRYDIDCVYTLLEPQHFDDVYRKNTGVKNLVYHLPGYVGDELLQAAKKHARPETNREIDVGYRGRQLVPYMGKGAMEKTNIATEFARRAEGSGLTLDIETKERKRIYKDGWYQFVARCRAMLGVEAGVSIFDTEDVVREGYETMVTENPTITFDELTDALLGKWEDNIYYRTISPRHFEAAAFRVCQILFVGKYSGAMQPMVHYIPLEKDFSNLDDVIKRFRDEKLRRELVENAHRDLIRSGRFSYENFMRGFDAELKKAGIETAMQDADVKKVSAILSRPDPLRYVRAYTRSLLLYGQFPGRPMLAALVRPLWIKYQKRATATDLYVWNSRHSKTQ